jgi:hypothetical protein
MTNIKSFGTSLSWTVNTREVSIEGAGVDKNKLALLRSDLTFPESILGYVSPSYEVVQNDKLIQLLEPFSAIGSIVNQGYLSYGKKVFVQFKINSQFRVAGQEHYSYFSLLNTHNGSSSLAIGMGNVRVICGNTFNMSLSELDTRLNHNIGINNKLDIGLVEKYLNHSNSNYKTQAEKLDSLLLSDSSVTGLIKHVFGDSDKVYNNIVHLYRSGAGNNGKTAYDLFSAVTDYGSHKGNEAKRIISPLLGKAARDNAKMLDTLLSLV